MGSKQLQPPILMSLLTSPVPDTVERTSPSSEPVHLAPESSLESLPRAFTTRRIPAEWLGGLVTGVAPRAGDLVLARVQRVGQHATLHLPSGRRKTLFKGDEFIAVYGNRYAPDQFEALVPESLEACDLVASGGILAATRAAHTRMSRPTSVEPLGLVTRYPGGPVVNLSEAALTSLAISRDRRIPVIAVVGTAMNAGKTTSAAQLVHGLTRSGLRVGFAKVTGTGAGGDPWLLADAGAAMTLDFTDAGHASTYLVDGTEVERVFETLVAHLQHARMDAIVLEVADGLYQHETAHLLRSSTCRHLVHAVLFAAADAMGAAAGVEWLKRHQHRIAGVTGVLTGSPLQMQEVREFTGQTVIPTSELTDVGRARRILDWARRQDLQKECA